MRGVVVGITPKADRKGQQHIRQELNHKALVGQILRGSWHEQGCLSWMQKNGCWKCLLIRMDVRTYKQATAGDSDVIFLQCESDLVVVAVDGMNA